MSDLCSVPFNVLTATLISGPTVLSFGAKVALYTIPNSPGGEGNKTIHLLPCSGFQWPMHMYVPCPIFSSRVSRSCIMIRFCVI